MVLWFLLLRIQVETLGLILDYGQDFICFATFQMLPSLCFFIPSASAIAVTKGYRFAQRGRWGRVAQNIEIRPKLGPPHQYRDPVGDEECIAQVSQLMI